MALISVPRDLPKPQGYASDGTDAIGFSQFWGNSPALDLQGDAQAAAFGPAAIGTQQGQQEPPKYEPPGGMFSDEGDGGAKKDPVPSPLPGENEGPVNILIAGGADLRHVLKTVARRRRHMGGNAQELRTRPLRFFLHESHCEVLARSVLFLQVINNTKLPVRERMELFLSLMGNSLIREKDSLYLSEIAKEFVEIITQDSEHPLTKILDLSHLKFKERDDLQDTFKAWDQAVPLDMEALRDARCRGYYRDRFDHRKNMMDFDYTTNIKPVAGIIHWFHYKEFCHSGVAFETRLGSYNTPNRSLSSYTEAKDRAKGTTVSVRGFWADIINSPYHSFGTTTDEEAKARLFKVSSSQYRHTETDIAEFNVTSYISEMDTGEQLRLPPETPEEHTFPYESPLERMRADKTVVEEVVETTGDTAKAVSSDASPSAGSYVRGAGRRKAKKKVAADWPELSAGFEGVEVVLLSGSLADVLKKTRYKGLFHRAFFGSMAALPFLEEVGIVSGDKAEARRVRQPPSVEAPDQFGTRLDSSVIAATMAEGAEVVFETLKYQAHFDGSARLAYRHRVAQAGHLVGWSILDERHSVPPLDCDIKENRARELERYATDFVRFVTGPCSSVPEAS